MRGKKGLRGRKQRKKEQKERGREKGKKEKRKKKTKKGRKKKKTKAFLKEHQAADPVTLRIPGCSCIQSKLVRHPLGSVSCLRIPVPRNLPEPGSGRLFSLQSLTTGPVDLCSPTLVLCPGDSAKTKDEREEEKKVTDLNPLACLEGGDAWNRPGGLATFSVILSFTASSSSSSSSFFFFPSVPIESNLIWCSSLAFELSLLVWGKQS
ncbi:uncharacterized protein ARB_03170 [Trichophyton benhamiae CBS 112371]|uniref:Uncharacterized protein n=1 Tax=Arthroderma benhamiae (strain ATCC MYA-4681 / CBS 112371) TaxID=663331 RepID=D4B3Y1_ARTBC|nr:uncharacterized protein ARB_03170 [Trichophyton benhamiae CBS 112371]EFE29829.1 hypothetical protein ARB_03170 [Trichophyton benhamiae CBS 112371]